MQTNIINGSQFRKLKDRFSGSGFIVFDGKISEFSLMIKYELIKFMFYSIEEKKLSIDVDKINSLPDDKKLKIRQLLSQTLNIKI